jgi:hypothetical protein
MFFFFKSKFFLKNGNCNPTRSQEQPQNQYNEGQRTMTGLTPEGLRGAHGAS